jgi:hypothetical protein
MMLDCLGSKTVAGFLSVADSLILLLYKKQRMMYAVYFSLHVFRHLFSHFFKQRVEWKVAEISQVEYLLCNKLFLLDTKF